VPDVVIVTGAGSNQKGTPEGYQLRSPPLARTMSARRPRPAPRPRTVHRRRAFGGRRPSGGGGDAARGAHALAAELGLRGPDVPDKITGWSHCTLHGQAAYDAYASVVAGIDEARLPFLGDLSRPGRPCGGDGTGDGDPGQPAKRGGRRIAVECACQPEPRRLQLTPKQIEDDPIVCGLCRAAFEQPEDNPGPK
jgi:hypothetical protein